MAECRAIVPIVAAPVLAIVWAIVLEAIVRHCSEIDLQRPRRKEHE